MVILIIHKTDFQTKIFIENKNFLNNEMGKYPKETYEGINISLSVVHRTARKIRKETKT